MFERSIEARTENRETAIANHDERYWKANSRIMAVLLLIWAIAGLGCGVLFADALNGIRLGGFPLGFWFAQQGSIVIFVLLILVYAVLLNRLDHRYRADLAKSGATRGDQADPEAERSGDER